MTYCPGRPGVDRCSGCPVLNWPRAEGTEAERSKALRKYIMQAVCPHDYKGGPAEWPDPPDHLRQAAS